MIFWINYEINCINYDEKRWNEKKRFREHIETPITTLLI
jgi:hypothetical protein